MSKRETRILLPNNQRQHRTSHASKDVLPLRICANYCAPCQGHRASVCSLAYAPDGLSLASGSWDRDVNTPVPKREFFNDNLLARIRSIIVMIRWTGLAP